MNIFDFMWHRLASSSYDLEEFQYRIPFPVKYRIPLPVENGIPFPVNYRILFPVEYRILFPVESVNRTIYLSIRILMNIMRWTSNQVTFCLFNRINNIATRLPFNRPFYLPSFPLDMWHFIGGFYSFCVRVLHTSYSSQGNFLNHII